MKKPASAETAPKSRKVKSAKCRKGALCLDAMLIQENLDELNDFLARHHALPQNSDVPTAMTSASSRGDLFRNASDKRKGSPSPEFYETYLVREKKMTVPAIKKR